MRDRVLGDFWGVGLEGMGWDEVSLLEDCAIVTEVSFRISMVGGCAVCMTDVSVGKV